MTSYTKRYSKQGSSLRSLAESIERLTEAVKALTSSEEQTDPPTPPAAAAGKVIVMPIRTSSRACQVIQLDLDPMPRVRPFGTREEVRTKLASERAGVIPRSQRAA
ncbi:MAG TPA: hypothetical protein VGL53_12505 [Bryobacteraceae bacterium]